MESRLQLASPAEISALSYANPRLAYVLVTNRAALRPNSYEVRGEFVTGNVNDYIEVNFRSRMYADAWVQRVQYTIHRPRYATGSPLKAWFDRQTREAPYIDVYAKIDGVDTWDMTNTPQPLENLFAASGNSQPDGMISDKGIVLPRDSTPFMKLTLTRQLEETEIPYIVRISFHCQELMGCRMTEISLLEAVARLRSIGYLPPADVADQGA